MSSLSQPRNAAFVTSRPSFVASEIRPLLQSRLRLACWLCCVTLLIMFGAELKMSPTFTPRVLFTVSVEAVNILIFGAASLVMWRIPEIPIARLRQIELIIVTSFAATTALTEYMWLIKGAEVAVASSGIPPASPSLWMHVPTRGMLFGDRDGMLMIAVGWGFPWIALLSAYTGWIPTNLRRSLALTAMVYVLAFTGTVAAALTVRELATTYLMVGGTMLLFMTPLTVMGLTAARKLETLRQQAYEARRLGQYTLERKLGEGGMGEVYLARHQFLRRPCAVKLIRSDAADAHSSLVRFEREVQAMAALTHPNTVEIFDYGRSDEGTFYYVMEYLPGLSLDELVRRYGALPPARVVYLLRQVCDALCEAHSVGLLHRDIKPSNVLLCERGKRQDVAKLLDFGLVQRIGERAEEESPAAAAAPQAPPSPSGTEDALAEKVTMAGSLVGTPAYMSPEQVIGNGPLDARSDIYSLGGVAYHLLTGQAPFGRRSTMEMMAAHLAESVAPPSTRRSGIPPDLEAVVMRCLEKEPAKRFPDAESLAQALAACACAHEWRHEDAAAWWRNHAASKPPAPTSAELPRPAGATPGHAAPSHATPAHATIEAVDLIVASKSIAK